MPESYRQKFGALGLQEALRRYSGLRIIPSDGGELVLAGDLHFRVQGPEREPIEDAYSVEIRIPVTFPDELPAVRETSGRIPQEYHHFLDGRLCLAPVPELELELRATPTLQTLIEGFVIPFLFGYSYRQQYGVAPFGESDHGSQGLLQYFAELFGIQDRAVAEEFVRLASLPHGQANRMFCPCGSSRRLGACHNRTVSRLRKKLGQHWFLKHYEQLKKMQLDEQADRERQHVGRRQKEMISRAVADYLRTRAVAGQSSGQSPSGSHLS